MKGYQILIHVARADMVVRGRSECFVPVSKEMAEHFRKRGTMSRVAMEMLFGEFQEVSTPSPTGCRCRSHQRIKKRIYEVNEYMDYCCICCRDTIHLKSFHCYIDDNIYHYCRRHAFIGRRVFDQYVEKKSLTKEQIEESRRKVWKYFLGK